MMLSHPKIETKFGDEKINVLIVENVELFRELCADISDAIYGDGDEFVLSNPDGKTESLVKTGLLVSDPLTVSLDDKKIVGKLYAELSKTATEKFSSELSQIDEKVIALVNKLNAESSVPIDISCATTIQPLLKAYGVAVKDDSDTPAEKLENFLTAAVSLCGVTSIFFVNIKSYLTESELTELYRFLRYNGVFTLLIESFAHKKLAEEFTVIIDEDLCEIVA